ncbi:retrovirus-related pol polyprotein from transposon TNT 1-94 [Tanacetum coccineum]|uniref:Retrovirus-related pol polyprotein from transposon TNT 1-94 n=1 Tax=Tanacetum coccineum TaxID=301880 RepID=A0ABQ5FIR1_9ASTR
MSKKLVVVTPLNKAKKVRFAEPVTSSSNIQEQVNTPKTQDSNKPLLPFTGLIASTSANRSKPTVNTKNNRISRPSSSKMQNKVEEQVRKVKSRSNKKNRVSKSVSSTPIEQSMLNANSEFICVSCNGHMFDEIYNECVLDFIQNVNVCAKSKSSNRKNQQKIWQPTSKVFTDIGYRWKPIRRTFTIDGNICPLTRITSTKVVPLNGTTIKPIITPNPEIKVYSRRPKSTKSVGSSSKSKIVESRISNNLEPTQSGGFNVSHVLSSSLIDFRLSKLFSGKKQKKHSHKPKSEDTNQEKLYLLHIDLCGPMRVKSINGKKYILVIIDDYSRFTWVKFLRSRDEAPEFIIKFLKMIQVRLNATVRNVHIDNGTEFVNQTLHSYYEDVGISHETSVARTPQQNGVVKRRNQTLVEAAYTMLIFAKASLFLEDLGKLKAKADVGIFIGYALEKKAYRIYNRRTRRIIETIHVDFDELTAMASEQFSLGPGP